MIDRALLKPMSRQVIRVGRFAVYIFKGTVGQHHIVRYPVPMRRQDADYRALLLRGTMRIVEVPQGVDLKSWKQDYVAGEGTEDLQEISVPGVYIRECTAETILACLSRNGRGFQFLPVNVSIGARISVPLGGVFVFAGVVTGDVTQISPDIDGSVVTLSAETKRLSLISTAPVRGLIGWI